jgi:hypothetical protein
LGHRIYSGEGRPFTVVRFRKGAGKLTPKYFGLHDFVKFMCDREEGAEA